MLGDLVREFIAEEEEESANAKANAELSAKANVEPKVGMSTEPKIMRVGRLDLRVVSHFESTCPNCQADLVFMSNPQSISMEQMYCKHCNTMIKLENPYDTDLDS